MVCPRFMEAIADKSFSRLLNLIRTIEEDPSGLESLRESNRFILDEGQTTSHNG